ncbi:MAG: transketolase, partial [Solirubrobacterales bacterium]|nr:transketolase [Solirubrobacterales bacterium]
GFKHENHRPTLIIVDSHIGYGAPDVQDTAKAHGEPLGEAEVRKAKRTYGWPEDAQFLIPDGVIDHFAAGVGARGRALRSAWEELFDRYRAAHRELADRLERMQRRELPDSWALDVPAFEPNETGVATRTAHNAALNAAARNLPWLVGGAADLTNSTGSTLTFDGAGTFSTDDRGGRYIHFGIREHAMGAIVNGLSLSKLRPYGATYLIFSDYAREPIRLSSLMELPAIWVFTHDSIGLGQDGPTHQPVEQLASLRAVPGLVTIRPCDANETVQAWRVIMELRHSPVALILTRQAVPVLDRRRYASAAGLERGAYILADPEDGEPELILIGTGSEVALCVDAYERLTAEGEKVRVVSMPSFELFDRQSAAYREAVLPPAIKARVSVEQASTLGWERFVGIDGAMIGMHTFGASAPLKDLERRFGFTPEAIITACRQQLATHGRVAVR